jgi:hypothetical protein
MKIARDQLKEELLAEAEAAIKELVEWCKDTPATYFDTDRGQDP